MILMEQHLEIVMIYLLIINFLSFLLMGWDKLSAIKDFRRVSEMRLYSFAAIGGFPAVAMAMFLFRHKISKPTFYRPFWAIVVVEVCLFVFLAIQ